MLICINYSERRKNFQVTDEGVEKSVIMRANTFNIHSLLLPIHRKVSEDVSGSFVYKMVRDIC